MSLNFLNRKNTENPNYDLEQRIWNNSQILIAPPKSEHGPPDSRLDAQLITGQDYTWQTMRSWQKNPGLKDWKLYPALDFSEYIALLPAQGGAIAVTAPIKYGNTMTLLALENDLPLVEYYAKHSPLGYGTQVLYASGTGALAGAAASIMRINDLQHLAPTLPSALLLLPLTIAGAGLGYAVIAAMNSDSTEPQRPNEQFTSIAKTYLFGLESPRLSSQVSQVFNRAQREYIETR